MALSFSVDAESGASLTSGQLERITRTVAAQLQAQRCVGERAVIMLPPGIEFLLALIDCWYGRVTAVTMPDADGDSSVQARQVVEDAGVRC
ncbi:peptide synthase [compost metagenome]